MSAAGGLSLKRECKGIGGEASQPKEEASELKTVTGKGH